MQHRLASPVSHLSVTIPRTQLMRKGPRVQISSAHSSRDTTRSQDRTSFARERHRSEAWRVRCMSESTCVRPSFVIAKRLANGYDSMVGACKRSMRATRQPASPGDRDVHALESCEQGKRSDGPREVHRASLTDTGQRLGTVYECGDAFSRNAERGGRANGHDERRHSSSNSGRRRGRARWLGPSTGPSFEQYSPSFTVTSTTRGRCRPSTV